MKAIRTMLVSALLLLSLLLPAGAAFAPAQEAEGAGAALEAYFALRESAFPGAARLQAVGDVPLSGAVRGQERARAGAIEAFQARLGLAITASKVTLLPETLRLEQTGEGAWLCTVYEWTECVYDDLRDGAGGSDTFAFGTWHRLRLEQTAAGLCVTADEYDEEDLFGLNTAPDAGEAEAPAAMPEEGTATLAAIDFYAGYDPLAAAEYANRYWKDYNPAYANFNSVGGDCANFASQCIAAGGMPQVTGSAYGYSGWFYRAANDRSATWTSTTALRSWMSEHRGLIATASDTSVYTGSPVFYNNAHTAICVGKNTAGRPIINAHNNDRYHLPWDYFGAAVTRTVQLTPVNHLSDETAPGTAALSGAAEARAGEALAFTCLADQPCRFRLLLRRAGASAPLTESEPGEDGVCRPVLAEPGAYTATLIASNAAGEKHSEELPFWLYGTPAAEAAIAGSASALELGESLSFTLSCDAPYARYYVEILAPDGTTALAGWQEDGFAFVPEQEGRYTAQVTAHTLESDAVSEPFRFTVFRPVEAALSLPAETLCLKTGETAELPFAFSGSAVEYLRVERVPEGVCAAGAEDVVWAEAPAESGGVLRVTGLAAGEAAVRLLLLDAERETLCCGEVAVTILQRVERVSLSRESLQLCPGGSETLLAEALPETAADRALTWRSSDPAVAAVDEAGRVTALAEGECEITAESGDGVSAVCRVTVRAPAVSVLALEAAEEGGVTVRLALTLPTERLGGVRLFAAGYDGAGRLVGLAEAALSPLDEPFACAGEAVLPAAETVRAFLVDREAWQPLCAVGERNEY